MEIWKSVKGYEGMYEVSNLGNVRSIDRIIKRYSYKKIIHYNIKGKVLKIMINNDGYGTFDITNKNMKAHRLVAITFIPNPNKLPCVNHINGIKIDNRIENLEWCTNKENTNHAWNTGLCKSKQGVKVWNSKLNDEKVKEIRVSDLSYSKLAEKYNVDKSLIYLVKKNKIWKHV